MRPWLALPLALLTLAAGGPRLAAQSDAETPRQKERIRALEAEIVRLQAEVDRLRSALDRARATPSSATSEADAGPAAEAVPAESAYTAFTAMPYGKDPVFLVTAARVGGSQDSTGNSRHHVAVDLLSLAATDLEAARRYQLRGTLYFAFPEGLPSGRGRHRAVVERLSRLQARRWFQNLQPGEIPFDGGSLRVYKQVEFARVPTSQTHFDGYEGNSGTVVLHRGRLHWRENNVFFLENGNLVLVGDGAARWHVRFLRDESATPLALR